MLPPLMIWYANNPGDVVDFEKQMRRTAELRHADMTRFSKNLVCPSSPVLRTLWSTNTRSQARKCRAISSRIASAARNGSGGV